MALDEGAKGLLGTVAQVIAQQLLVIGFHSHFPINLRPPEKVTAEMPKAPGRAWILQQVLALTSGATGTQVWNDWQIWNAPKPPERSICYNRVGPDRFHQRTTHKPHTNCPAPVSILRRERLLS
jgi:hypothetical protein